MEKYAIGADIGGSHISCAVIDLEKESIRKESYVSQKVDNQASADEILHNWAAALKKSISQIDPSQLAGIGFAMPGPFEYDKGIARFTNDVAKYQHLFGVDVAKEMKRLLGLKEGADVRFMNDASSFAVGEAWMGKALGSNRSVSITLGTGFGSAFVDGGVPVVERHDVPKMGCVWHLPFKDGIADDYFSTRWYIKRYAEKSKVTLGGVKEIADRAASEPMAKKVFAEFGDNLGVFLGPWLKKFETNTLVIGGNVAGAYSLFGSSFEAALKTQQINIRIGISELMEDAALIGAARLFDKNFWEKIKPLLSKM